MIDTFIDSPDNPDLVDVAEMYERAAKYPKLCFRCTREYGKEYAAPAVMMLGNERLCGKHAMERVDEQT